MVTQSRQEVHNQHEGALILIESLDEDTPERVSVNQDKRREVDGEKEMEEEDSNAYQT